MGFWQVSQGGFHRVASCAVRKPAVRNIATGWVLEKDPDKIREERR